MTLARTWLRLGGYRRYRRIRWSEVRRLVFLCKGNICRSPYAEYRARALGMPAVSAGIQAAVGSPAEPIAVAEAGRRGVDLPTARSTPVVDLELRAGDLVLFMEPRQVRGMPASYSAPGVQVSLLGLWSVPANPFIPDPWGRGEAAFEVCFDLIDTGVAELVRRISLQSR